MTKLKLLISVFILVPVIDFLWIGLLMKPFYMRELGTHKRMMNGEFSPQLLPAVFVYVLLSIAVVFFILSWVSGWAEALAWGALLGFIIYGVYDLTNLSTLADYSWRLTLTDMAWGSVLLGSVSVIAYFEQAWLDS